MATSLIGADLLPQEASKRFGLQLDRDDFDQLREELDRIGEAERAAEVTASVLKIF